MEVLLINELPSQVSPHCYFDWVGGLFFFFFFSLAFSSHVGFADDPGTTVHNERK